MNVLKECLKDTEYELPGNKFVKNGYKFIGWNTAANGTGVSFNDGDVVTNLTEINDENVILYAQWILDERIYVQFIYNLWES